MGAVRIDEKRHNILQDDNHLLIMGGPGSGKTTMALLKARKIVEKKILKREQKILFLSFARATISRVEEQAGNILDKDVKKQLEISTYHGFAWSILKSHGYLLNNKVNRIISPHDAATMLAEVEKSERHKTIKSLFTEQGLIHFDLFAELCYELLNESISLRTILSDKYPIIILDEFQDTNVDEWNFIRLLGLQSRLIALADPNQRIYEFRGSDPNRINDYMNLFSPSYYDFCSENNRSTGRDINEYGNDILTGKNKNKEYKDVCVIKYPPKRKSYTHMKLKIEVLKAYNRIKQQNIQNWSIAVLVPTNSLMLDVSEFLLQKQRIELNKVLPAIKHDVAISSEGPALAAEFIATLLEYGSQKKCNEKVVIKSLNNHILGRKGEKKVSQSNIALVNALVKYLEEEKIRGKNRIEIVNTCKDISNRVNGAVYTGNVINDWIAIQNIIRGYNLPQLKDIENDAKFIKLLRRGSQLNAALGELWRMNGNYENATEHIAEALTQEHFSMASKTWTGINLMTIHKAKGKEFDEVIVYEDLYKGRIVFKPDRIEQARLNLRVAVTRARNRTTILTPESKPCELVCDND